MSLNQLLSEDKLKPHSTSATEISALRAIVAREMSDAALSNLSRDRKFACLYNAALQLGHMVIACAGYRINPQKPGFHALTFTTVEAVIGPTSTPLTSYFDICRRKRNKLDYDTASLITQSEVEEIAVQVPEFEALIENWITANYSQYKKP